MRSSLEAASRPRIALVGCGEVCEHKHLPALRRVPGARVVALADTDPARLAEVGDKFAIRRRYASVDALLDDQIADIVGVLVPPGAHRVVAEKALAAGCHVLIEKPLALSLEDAQALVSAERPGGPRAEVGHHMRWHRVIRRGRDVLESGGIGTAESLRAVWSSPRSDDGIPGWKLRRTTGGGALVELGVHLFDLFRFLPATEVEEVFAESRHGSRDDERVTICATLANGMLASASLSERSSHDLELHLAGNGGRLRLACQRFDGFERYGIHETDGMIRPRLRHLLDAVRGLPGALARRRGLGDYGDSYRAQWEHMMEVARGAEPGCPLAEGQAALRVVFAATESAQRGVPVRVESGPTSITPVQRR